MAIPHAQPGDVIDIRPLGSRVKDTKTATLIKTECLEVLRLVVPKGKEIAPHQVAGEITVQCLEGRLAFTVNGVTRELQSGEMLYLEGGSTHAVRGIEDASALISILLPRRQS